jgi:iron complex outermembrane receptor protein
MMKCLLVTCLLFSTTALVKAEESKIKLDSILVTGERDDLSMRRDAATQKVVIDRKEIDNMSVTTIAEVLGKLPGVEVKSGGQRARGMSRDSVKILIDGERQSSQVVMGAMGLLPSGELERIEILRGSSAEYGGSSAITVNLVMKKAIPKRSTEFRAGLGLRGDEFGGVLSWSENGGSGNFGWSVPVSLFYNNSPFETRTDKQDSVAGIPTLWEQEQASGASKVGHYSISPKFTWKSGQDSLRLSSMISFVPSERNSKMLLSKANPATNTTLDYNGDRDTPEDGLSRTLRLRIEGEKHFADTKLTARTAFTDGRLTSDLVRNSRDELGVLTISNESTNSHNSEFNSAIRLDKPFGEHLISVGAEYVKVMSDDDQAYLGGFTQQSIYVTSSRDAIVWMQDDWTPEEKMTLTTGLRIENMSLNADLVSQQQAAFLPSIALRWQPTEQWVIRSSLGAGLKMPKLNEISNATVRSIIVNTPTEADKRGNPNLNPERSLNFEAIVERYLAEKLGVIGANLYVRSTSNFIERRVQLEDVRWVDRPQNEGDALHWGLELDAKVRMDKFGWNGATVKSHLTLPHAEVNDVRLGIQRMARDTPHYILSMGLDQSLPRLQSSYGVSLQILGRSNTYIPNEQNAYNESRVLLDAFWLYKINQKFNLRVAGQNLLAADSHSQNTYTSGINDWKLDTRDLGYRTLMITLEGRW